MSRGWYGYVTFTSVWPLTGVHIQMLFLSSDLIIAVIIDQSYRSAKVFSIFEFSQIIFIASFQFFRYNQCVQKENSNTRLKVLKFFSITKLYKRNIIILGLTLEQFIYQYSIYCSIVDLFQSLLQKRKKFDSLFLFFPSCSIVLFIWTWLLIDVLRHVFGLLFKCYGILFLPNNCLNFAISNSCDILIFPYFRIWRTFFFSISNFFFYELYQVQIKFGLSETQISEVSEMVSKKWVWNFSRNSKEI